VTVQTFRLENGGVTVDILTLGGVIHRVLAPGRHGGLAEIALGYADLADYVRNPAHFGALTGRVANRIADGRIEIDGTTYFLARNQGRDTLHGGDGGFHGQVWAVEAAASDRLHLSLESPDGDQGFPGLMRVDAVYSLGPDASLRLDFHARTSRPTVVNLTSHAYWNLAGEGSGDILDHDLMVEADAFTPMTPRMMPTGEILPVYGTPFDFRAASPLRPRVEQASDPQIAIAGGIDHNFVLGDKPSGALALAARLRDPLSGRTLEVLTTQPGLQVYSGNSLAGGPPGKSGRPYAEWEGIALETQHFPDAPHHPNFPSILLRPGEVFRSSTVFRFGVSAHAGPSGNS
jgi:aldose 1-epimerase